MNFSFGVFQYGGNPVSCAVALAVMDAIETDKLRENAVTVGNHLMRRFTQLMEKHKLIGDVRFVTQSRWQMFQHELSLLCND